MRGIGRRIAGDEGGAAAAEFALVMIPFLGLILIAMQTAIVFLMDQALQTATKAAARQLMTGSAQTSSMSAAGFRQSVCNAAPYIPCAGVMVDVKSGSNFQSLNTNSLTLTYNGQGQVTNSFSYSPGGPGDVVIVQVMYDWPIFGGAFAAPLVNQPNSTRLLVATVVFKNEPYA